MTAYAEQPGSLIHLDVEKYKSFQKESKRKKEKGKRELSKKNVGDVIGEFPSSEN